MILIVMVLYLIIYFVFRKKIDKWLNNQSIFIQLAIIITFVILFVLCFMFYLDYYNIPSILHLTNNINAREYIGYVFTLLSSGISALVLIIITRIQIQDSERQHLEKILEDRKNNNMPLLFYDINEKITESDLYAANKLLKGNYSDVGVDFDYKYYNLYITNVGLNAAKNVSVKIVNNKEKNYITKITQSVIGKGLVEHSTMLFFYNEISNEKIIVEVQYEDLFGNSYKQKIIICLEITNYYSNNRRKIVMSYDVNEPIDCKKLTKKKNKH